jgi:hypothetical protein
MRAKFALKDVRFMTKINGFVKMDLQKRAQETALSGLVDNMLPSAIFNRFDLSDSNGSTLSVFNKLLRS